MKAGKLNERVLRVFMATGNEEGLAIIAALKIKIDLTPIVPTRKSLVLYLKAKKLHTCLLRVCSFFLTLVGCDEKFRMNWSRR